MHGATGGRSLFNGRGSGQFTAPVPFVSESVKHGISSVDLSVFRLGICFIVLLDGGEAYGEPKRKLSFRVIQRRDQQEPLPNEAIRWYVVEARVICRPFPIRSGTLIGARRQQRRIPIFRVPSAALLTFDSEGLSIYVLERALGVPSDHSDWYPIVERDYDGPAKFLVSKQREDGFEGVCRDENTRKVIALVVAYPLGDGIVEKFERMLFRCHV